MAEPLSIAQADALDKDELLITLSDGRNLVVTLAQVLSINPRVLPPDEPDDD